MDFFYFVIFIFRYNEIEVIYVRPHLNIHISADDFLSYYWLKEELVTFCREQKLSTQGSKNEITKRIAVFLETGAREKPIKKQKTTQKKTNNSITLETVIEENHICTQEERAFFQNVIGTKFKFSVHIQNFFKNNVGKTYQDVVTEWHEEEKRKKDPSYRTSIDSQFEYNQFFRAFFDNPDNKGKTKQDAIASWKIHRSKRKNRT